MKPYSASLLRAERGRRALGHRHEAAAGDVVGALAPEVGVVELSVATSLLRTSESAVHRVSWEG